MKEGRKPEHLEKTPGDELQFIQCLHFRITSHDFFSSLQRWSGVTAGVHGLHDQSGDRERAVELGSGAGFPSSDIRRKALYYCSGTVRSKYLLFLQQIYVVTVTEDHKLSRLLSDFHSDATVLSCWPIGWLLQVPATCKVCLDRICLDSFMS